MIDTRAQRLRTVLFVMSVAWVPPGLVWGQSTSTGNVMGQVRDPKGLGVAGATVKLTDVATGGERSAETNESGRYLFSDASPGTYASLTSTLVDQTLSDRIRTVDRPAFRCASETEPH